mmetsp:Transcript_11963/g.38499  ORF Transcript_11963/g.38499 Transcript_11963/m.38499 type:complete len:204 (+) Transcript_11963:101-712(+)
MDLEGFAQEDPRGELDFGPVPESPKVDHRGKLSALHCRPDDGLLLDADFEHICRTTVAAQSQRLVLQTMHQAKVLSKEGGIGGESVVTTSPSRLANFFRGDGAVYAQYNLAAATYSGGALPTPWTAQHNGNRRSIPCAASGKRSSRRRVAPSSTSTRRPASGSGKGLSMRISQPSKALATPTVRRCSCGRRVTAATRTRTSRG